MRIESKVLQVIQEQFKPYRNEGDLYLFGSRLDDHKKGGDIDLLFLCTDGVSKELLLSKKLEILVQIKKRIGERKIDLVIRDSDPTSTSEFLQEVLKTAKKIPLT